MPAARDFKSARKALERGELDPVYYITGDQEILKDELVASIVEAAVDPSSRDFNLDTRSAGDLTPEALNALLETPPMLAERRVAVVRNIEQWRKNSKVWKVLLAYLENPSPTTVTVLTHGPKQKVDPKLAARAVHVPTPAIGRRQTISWIGRRVERLGMAIDDAALQHLVSVVGDDLSQLAVELDKLVLALEPERPIQLEDVENLVGVRHGETAEDWIDAVVARDLPRAAQLADIVLAGTGTTAVSLVAQLGTAMVGLRLTRAYADAGRRGRALHDQMWNLVKAKRPQVGKYGPAVKRWTTGHGKWTAAELDAALRILYSTDQQLKDTTVTDARGILHSMLLRLHAPREAA